MNLQFQLSEACAEISRRVDAIAGQRCLVVALSGIDSSGKTTTARTLAQGLESRSLKTAVVHLDDWHTAPEIRFSTTDPGKHFYLHAYRFEELFERLVNPLRVWRRCSLAVTLRRLPDNLEFPYNYEFDDIDVLIVEGIFLLKADLRREYDYTIWIDCTFETALARAIQRDQEGLSSTEIEADYRRIYFPAQEIHMLRDAPRASADLVVSSDKATMQVRTVGKLNEAHRISGTREHGQSHGTESVEGRA